MSLVCGLGARPAAAQDERRIYIDFRVGASHLADGSYERSVEVPMAAETATLNVAYAFGSGGHFDFGGGYMFTPVIGVGVNIAADYYESFPVLSVRLPSPAFLHTFATDSFTGDTVIARGEVAVHPQIMINATPGKDLRVRVFGGPSFFQVDHDLVSTIKYSQEASVTLPVNTVEITGYDFSRQTDGGVGFHLGGDVSYFFKRTVGAGGYVSYWHGRAEFTDRAGTFDVGAGGVSSGGSINFRF